MRLDAYTVCSMNRRTVWRMQEDIGSWSTVFQTLSFANVLTNACLIGFVGSQMANRIAEPGEDTSSFIERFRMYQPNGHTDRHAFVTYIKIFPSINYISLSGSRTVSQNCINGLGFTIQRSSCAGLGYFLAQARAAFRSLGLNAAA